MTREFIGFSQTTSLLGTSLEYRLKPRLAEAHRAGILIDRETLSRMAKNTDKQWTKSLVYPTKIRIAKEQEP
jgi:hypothetical protein